MVLEIQRVVNYIIFEVVVIELHIADSTTAKNVTLGGTYVIPIITFPYHLNCRTK